MNKAKEVHYDNDAREKLMRGIDMVADAVKVTLGPKGRNVIIDRGYGAPHITKDGVTVAAEIVPEDAVEGMGARMVIEVAGNTVMAAGDGTSTASILAQAIAKEGLKMVAAGMNPIDIQKGIRKAVKEVVKYIKENSKEVGDDFDKIMQVATVSANNDEEIGKLITEGFQKVGVDGVMTVEDARGFETTIKVIEGMEFDRGMLSPYFMNTDKGNYEVSNPVLFLADSKISTTQEILPAAEYANKNGRPLVIIADELDGQAMTFLIANRLQGKLNVCAIKAPGFGDRKGAMLEDIAVLTGGTAISEEKGFRPDTVQPEHFGTCDKIVVTKDSTTIVGGAGKDEEVAARVDQIKTRLEVTESDYEKEKLQERIGKLTTGVAILYVGGMTEVELKERKDRMDDAIAATRAAIAEGIIPGGGTAFVRASALLENVETANDGEKAGVTIIKEALLAPLKQICDNGADHKGDVVINEIQKSKTKGYNARTGEYEDLLKAGVIDPAKVARVALENAASSASMLLTTECAIVEKPSPEEPPMGGMPGGMGMPMM